MTEWIPIAEQLPEVNEVVLISYHYEGDPEFSEFFPSHDGVTISFWTGIKNHGKPHFDEMGDSVTVLAWQPLPSPYSP